MTEDDARRVLLLRAYESPPGPAPWTADDRDWATRQAIAAVGADARPAHFVATRAALALPRLLPRAPEAERWLQRRGWHPALVLLALLLGLLGGLAVDQLGPPQRVNLLAPAMWAVVLWNLFVYAALWLPAPPAGPLVRWLAGRGRALPRHPQLNADWLQVAAPLMARRAALLLHTAAAGLALGLIAGLYLRGLVMDYRAGWQSTFLDPASVQAALRFGLWPASALTGVPVADVAPLRLAPGDAATASAAPWIHLFAATLLLAVVLPRTLLAGLAAWRAAWLARHLPLALDDAYFEGLHPLMRPGGRRPFTLLWCPLGPPAGPVRLFGQAVEPPDDGVQRLFDAGDGDQLHLRALPAVLRGAVPLRPAWRRWWRPDPAGAALAALRREVDAVLVLLPPEPAPASARPAWLATLSRPLLLLQDSRTAVAPELPLRALDDGWLGDGLLWQALAHALPDDRRRERLDAAWRRSQAARLDDTAALLAASLARLAQAREPLPEARLFGGGADAAQATEAARQRLVQQLDAEFVAVTERLAPLWGRGEPAPPVPGTALQPRRQARVAEGRAALWGGVASGALAGLKADLATGGLTLGAGAVAGGLLGALGAAGVARGINTAQGRGQSHVDWGAAELDAMAAALLRLPLGLAAPAAAVDASAAAVDAPAAAVAAGGDRVTADSPAGIARREAALQAALQAEAEPLAAAWRDRGPTLPNRLAPVLVRVLKAALGGPADYTRAP
jgi:hypothetical protein